MPQREFWTSRIPCGLTFEYRTDPTADGTMATATVRVLDQSGETMRFSAAALPEGFELWAFTDAVKQAVEGYGIADADAAVSCWSTAIREWKRAARELYP